MGWGDRQKGREVSSCSTDTTSANIALSLLAIMDVMLLIGSKSKCERTLSLHSLHIFLLLFELVRI